MTKTKQQSESRRGGVLIYVMAMFPLLLIIVALSVDFGRILVAKSELDTAVTAAMRAGGNRILEGASYYDVMNSATGVATANKVDNFGISVANGDIRTGVYVPATKQFYPTADMSVVNAIRVTLRHKFDDSNMPLFFWKFAAGGADKTITATRTIMVAEVSPEFLTKVITTSTPPTTVTTPGTTKTNTVTNTTNNTKTNTTTTTKTNSNTGTQSKPKTTPPSTKTNTNTTNTNTSNTTSKTTTTSTPPKTTTTPGTTTTTTVTTPKSTGKKFLQQVD
jgi:hypothetical protein